MVLPPLFAEGRQVSSTTVESTMALIFCGALAVLSLFFDALAVPGKVRFKSALIGRNDTKRHRLNLEVASFSRIMLNSALPSML